MTYDLHWKSVPMPSIGPYVDNWYWPYLGKGVYMHVLATSGNSFLPYYIGKSKDIGRRWVEHVKKFHAPPRGYHTPIDADAFLEDPVQTFNNYAVEQGLANAAEVWRKILKNSWFVYAEVRKLDDQHSLRHVEWCLQQAAMRHHGIEAPGFIGDLEVGHQPPNAPLMIRNRFGRPFLETALSSNIAYVPGQEIYIF